MHDNTYPNWFIRSVEFLFVITLCYFPLCYRIDALSIRQWDEARNAVNAIEMLQNHKFLVRYYDGNPETWEVKPPMLIWLQVLSLKVFGFNQLAIRFPTILATFMTVLFLIWYFNKYHHNRYIGYMAALVLVTSQGYIDRHIARTGDHDALLILIATVVIFLYYEFLISKDSKNSMVLLFAVLFVIGVLTKSIAIFFIFPGLLFSTYVFKARNKIFDNKWFYIAFFIFIIGAGSYYVLRGLKQPGYLKIVWQSELFHRYLNRDNLYGSTAFWDYGRNFFTSRYQYWIYFLLISFVLLPLYYFKNVGFLKYLVLNTVTLFIILSIGSKQLWYDGLLFPLFAAIIAFFLYSVIPNLYHKLSAQKKLKDSLIFLIFIPLIIYPGKIVMKNASRSGELPWDTEIYALGNYLSEPGNLNKIKSETIHIVFLQYSAHLLFYVEGINLKENRKLIDFKPLSEVKTGDLILMSEQSARDSIKRRFHYEILDEKNSAYLIRILQSFDY